MSTKPTDSMVLFFLSPKGWELTPAIETALKKMGIKVMECRRTCMAEEINLMRRLEVQAAFGED